MNEIKVRLSDEKGNNGELLWADPMPELGTNVVQLLNNPVGFDEYATGSFVMIDENNNVVSKYVDLELMAKGAHNTAKALIEKESQRLARMEEVLKITGTRVLVGEKVGIVAGYNEPENGSSSFVTVLFQDGSKKIMSPYNAQEVIDKYNRVHG
ncbi:unnamed protein product [Fructobacillus fructosus]|uniref:hypothetical protein n=1 Tax=Fructobacillus fructosus TaxID=1631 RepID=UPI002D84FB2F|nr:unnamed protein product [Fructobacillus fructosus]